MAPSTRIRIGFQPKEPKNSWNFEQRFNLSLYWISNHTMKWTANEILYFETKWEGPGAKCSLHSKPFTFQSPWDFWAKRAVQLSESAINFLAETKICLFAAAIQTTRKNHQCIFGNFENIFGFNEIFFQKDSQLFSRCHWHLKSYWWVGFVNYTGCFF